MTEVLISFSRPSSLAEPEMRAWFAERARGRGPGLTVGRSDRSSAQVLRVQMHTDSPEAAEVQLTDLMLDMRLLGLRPAVVRPAEDGYEYR